MTGRTAALLLAELVVVLVIICRELRGHQRWPIVRPPRLRGGTSIWAVALPGLLAAALTFFGSLFGRDGAAIGLALAPVMMLWSYLRAGKGVLARCGARQTTNRNLLEDARELAAKVCIPVPRLFETQELQPNAFALSPGFGETAIVLTLGLRNRLNGDELHAVVAREIVHIASRNRLNLSLAMTLLGVIAGLARLLGLIGIAGPKNGIQEFLFTAIFAPFSWLVLYLATPSTQEYRADREAAVLCGSPDDLVSALLKLDGSTRRRASITANDQPALSSLFVVNPLPDFWVGRLFSALPPVSKRVHRLARSRIPPAQIATTTQHIGRRLGS
jgi:heat shock protein HtpX